MDRPDLIDTVRSEPDRVTARASVARLELVAETGALDLAVDTADTIKARNSLEKMLAHQIAAAHGLAMKFAAKSEQMLGFVSSWDTAARQQVSSIEASRLANSAARMLSLAHLVDWRTTVVSLMARTRLSELCGLAFVVGTCRRAKRRTCAGGYPEERTAEAL